MKTITLCSLYLRRVGFAALSVAPSASANCGNAFACAQTTMYLTVTANCGGNCGSFSFNIPYGYMGPMYYKWDTYCVSGCCGQGAEDNYYLTSLECILGPKTKSAGGALAALGSSQILLIRGCHGEYSAVNLDPSI